MFIYNYKNQLKLIGIALMCRLFDIILKEDKEYNAIRYCDCRDSF